jgi:hypothetical protein
METYRQVKNPDTQRYVYVGSDKYNELLKTYTKKELCKNSRTTNKSPKVKKVEVDVLSILPNEMIIHILTQSDYNQALRMCSTNKRVSQICKDNPQLWKPLIEKIKEVMAFKNKHNIVVGKCKKNTPETLAQWKNYLKALLFTAELAKGWTTYESNGISVHNMKQAFPGMVKLFKGWDSNEKLFFKVYQENGDIVFSEENYVSLDLSFSLEKFICGLAYLYNKRAIKLKTY